MTIFVEKISTRITLRPEIEAVRTVLREGNTPVITKFDRLARSLLNLIKIADEPRKEDEPTVDAACGAGRAQRNSVRHRYIRPPSDCGTNRCSGVRDVHDRRVDRHQVLSANSYGSCRTARCTSSTFTREPRFPCPDGILRSARPNPSNRDIAFLVSRSRALALITAA